MKRYIYIMVHQRYIKGYIKGTSRGTSILILFINTLYKYYNIIANMKSFSCLTLFFFFILTLKRKNKYLLIAKNKISGFVAGAGSLAGCCGLTCNGPLPVYLSKIGRLSPYRTKFKHELIMLCETLRHYIIQQFYNTHKNPSIIA